MKRRRDDAANPPFSECVLNEDIWSASGTFSASVHDSSKAEEASRPSFRHLPFGGSQQRQWPSAPTICPWPYQHLHTLRPEQSEQPGRGEKTCTSLQWSLLPENCGQGAGSSHQCLCSVVRGGDSFPQGQRVGGMPYSCPWDMGPCFTVPGPPDRKNPSSP